jgi:hypothetical protein
VASKLPYVPLELLEYLEKNNPDRMPDTFASELELGKKIGAVLLIRRLRQLYDDQVKASLGHGDKK